jgi:hypothetical protein
VEYNVTESITPQVSSGKAKYAPERVNTPLERLSTPLERLSIPLEMIISLLEG